MSAAFNWKFMSDSAKKLGRASTWDRGGPNCRSSLVVTNLSVHPHPHGTMALVEQRHARGPKLTTGKHKVRLD